MHVLRLYACTCFPGKQLVSQLHEHLLHATTDRESILKLLDPDLEQTSTISTVTAVERHLLLEQRERYFLLKDIDRLSRKLRGMSSMKASSGLFSLLQSAVTGQPEPDIVDYRFLSNHISLLEADAEHIQKKLAWKEAEVKTLQRELCALKSCGGSSAMARLPGSGLELGLADAVEVDQIQRAS
ncbi:hypothetical protein ElyMa_006820800 [Elysia marginata]|uniref:Uncharacterized protein n=1 Tax=Elysia marginata TaxID=1093978 RepID=A0AAV4J5Y0_9GAST|nr:hypothetical protein ElyMa_006820800 [Elysia marginata]